MAGIPHFAFPFRFTAAGPVAAVDQDTPEDVAGCVAALCCYRVGDRVEAPDFGLEPQEFRTNGPNPTEIRLAIMAWEDRAEVALELDDDALLSGVADVSVFLTSPGAEA